MANISEQSEFTEEIQQVEIGEPVAGGASGPVNRVARAIINRTRWLKDKYTVLAEAMENLSYVIGDADLSDILKKANNLSDVPDKAAARNNLDAASNNHEHDAAYLKKAKNLEDIDNTLTARSNLGVADIHFVTSAPGRALGKDGDIAIQDVSNATPIMYRKRNGSWIPTLTAHDTELPGTFKWFCGKTVPEGYLKCNGAAVSRTQYQALFAAIGTTYGIGNGTTTFNLPDVRGNAIRGYDDGRGIDSKRAFGSEQESQNKSHRHGIATGEIKEAGEHVHNASTTTGGEHNHDADVNNAILRWGTDTSLHTGISPSEGGSGTLLHVRIDSAGSHTHKVTVEQSTKHRHVIDGYSDYDGDTEARMRNIAFMPIIKY